MLMKTRSRTLSTAANSIVSQNDTLSRLEDIKRSKSIFGLELPETPQKNFEEISLNLPKTSKKIRKKVKFPVFKEDQIFRSRLRSTKRMMKESKELKEDNDNPSDDQNIDDSIYYTMKYTLRFLVDEGKIRGDNLPVGKGYWKVLIDEYNVEFDTEEEDGDDGDDEDDGDEE